MREKRRIDNFRVRICRISHLKLRDDFGLLIVVRVATALSLSLQHGGFRMSNKLFGYLVVGALASALALASPALARGGGGGGGGGGHGGMGGGGHMGGGMGGGGHWGGGMGGGGMHWAGGGGHWAGGGMHWAGGGMRWAGGRHFAAMGPHWAGGWHPRARFAFNHRFFHHRFNRFAFAFAGAPYYDYGSYDYCWRRVWTAYGPQVVNVCGDYGY
jgi:hypothetical protein